MLVNTIVWTGKSVRIIDQTRLPGELVYLDCRNLDTLWQAIRELKVRGAPALGIAAAYGVLLGIKDFKGTDSTAFVRRVGEVCDYIGRSRPTAVNLFASLRQMRLLAENNRSCPVSLLRAVLQAEARAIFEEDRAVCRAIGQHGAQLVPAGGTLMTVCNAGALATADYGTALGVMYAARKAGRKFRVYALETRPLLQGARLTAWELMKNRIDVTLVCDNMAAALMRDKGVDVIFAGADRIAANGDTANKIGTYMLAVLAEYHRIPFYIVAPRTTFDLTISDGTKIPVEERSAQEVTSFGGARTAPAGVKVYNPAFDVTPHTLVSGIVTEYGIIRRPDARNIRRFFKRAQGRSR